MGKWFANYFISTDDEVTVYDSENEIKGKSFIFANSLVGAVLKVDYVMLCEILSSL